MTIDFGAKLTSSNFHQFYSKFYQNSFNEEAIFFDLSRLEWISIELATFWFAWVAELNSRKISLSVQLQKTSDDPKVNTRRKKCLNHLISQWKLAANLYGAKMHDGGIKADSQKLLPNPFVMIDSIPYESGSFDEEFDDIYKIELKDFSDYARQLLSEHSNLNYFDNQYLSYSILKEFFSNVCQHAYSKEQNGKAFISIKVNSKISGIFSDNVVQENLNQRQKERALSEQPFFLDDNGKLTNDDFIELCFLDFGWGITNTLREKYDGEDMSRISEELHIDHKKQNLDCRILEYSFLLFTSKYELGRHFELHNFIPRGLFIIKEIVSRNKGMIVARSGKGKVIFDFSKSQDIEHAVRYENYNKSFEGTFISITLPTRKKQKNKGVVSLKKDAFPRSIDAINLLKIITESKSKSKEDPLEQQRNLYEVFFTSLANRMKSSIGEQKLMIVDFAGIELRNNDLVNKLIYFFAFCPIVTEKNQLCLINVIDRGLNESLVFAKQLQLRNKGFYPKPIPVIHPNLEVTWIGIRDSVMEYELSKMWKDGSPLYESQHNVGIIEGNVIELHEIDERQSQVNITIPNFWELCKVIKHEISKFITAEVANNGIQFPALMNESHNYNHVQQVKSDKRGNKRAFQAANGKYQKRHFSFIEKLYVLEYRRGLACYLITFFYIDKWKGAENFGAKILTVTLSSQLLGKEVADILQYLSGNKTNYELIPLSNYYEFHKEEPFQEIKPGDKIIVVNDVVSTGSLSYNLYHSINERRGEVLAILSLLDNRLDEEKESKEDVPIVGLLNIRLHKYNQNPYPNTQPIRINPILNSPTTMSRSKSGEEHILLQPTEFLQTLNSSDILMIGQYKVNTVYHYYYLSTSHLFLSDKLNDYQLTGLIFERFFSIVRKRREISSVSIDFVFYPFFSSVSYLIDDIRPILRKYTSNTDFEILPVPRIMTPKGWRFSFPPKHLNLLTEKGEKSALLLDDGACTGETLMQLIDTISFLNLSEIYVLVLFARLEDFQREFYTKIKAIEVAGKKVNVHLFFGTQFHIPVYQKTTTPAYFELMRIDAVKEYYSNNGIDLPGFVSSYIDYRVEQLEDFKTPVGEDEINGFSEIGKLEMFLVRDMLGRYDSYRLFKEDEPGSDTPNPVNEKLFFKNKRNLRILAAVLLHEPYLIDTASRINPEILQNLIGYFESELNEMIKEEHPRSFDEFYFYLRCIVAITPYKLREKDFLYKILTCIDEFYIEANDDQSITEVNIICGLLSFNFLESLVGGEKVYNRDNYFSTRNLIRTVWHDMSEQARENKIDPQFESAQATFSNKIFRLLYVTIIPRIGMPSNSYITPFVKVQDYYSKLTIEGINHKYVTDYNNFEKLSEALSGFINVSSTLEERQKFVKDFKKYKSEAFDSIIDNLEKVLNKLSGYQRMKSEYTIERWKGYISYLKNQISSNLNDNFNSSEPARELLIRLKDWFSKFNNEILSPASPLLRFILDANSDIIEVWKETINEYNHSFSDDLQIVLKVDAGTSLPKIKIHPYILKLIFLHILSNRRKFAPNAKCEYSAFVGQRNGKRCVILVFKQHAKFIQDINGSRGLSDIRYMLDVYGGNYNHVDREKYTFEIVFPLNVINNE